MLLKYHLGSLGLLDKLQAVVRMQIAYLGNLVICLLFAKEMGWLTELLSIHAYSSRAWLTLVAQGNIRLK